jgi:acetyl-CoA synthetase
MAREDIAWRPDPAQAAASNLGVFMRSLGVANQAELVRRADADPGWFHEAFLRHIDFRFYRTYTQLLDDSRGAAWARWCVGGTTNVILNALDRWRGTPTYARRALHWVGEDGQSLEFTYRDLDHAVCRFAHGLRRLGVQRGDVVAIYLPNVPEAVIAMLAVPKIGAIVMPLFSGFGADAIAARLAVSRAKVLIASDAALRRGRPTDTKAIADEAVAMSPAVKHVIVVRRFGTSMNWVEGRDRWWSDVIAQDDGENPAEAVATEEMVADAPYLLIFTSGTSGKPKGVAHTHCGFPVKCAIDLGLMQDYRPEDRLIWMSDMGWVVGPMLVYGVPVMGGSFMLVEGAPNYPDPDRMWRLCAEHRVSYLGIAPTTARTFMAQGSDPASRFDLSALRIVISSGEPWTPDAWRWCFEHVCARRAPLLNFSGGTEMIGIVMTSVVEPIKPCTFNAVVPGIGADVFEEPAGDGSGERAAGRRAAPGTVGELVMRGRTIGLTRSLWDDDERYLETYWRTWPEVWHHGDFASRDADGYWRIHGRSDDTLKIAGKRTGPAEVESLLMGTGRLAEAAAIGVPDPVKGSALVCVVAAKPDVAGDDTLAGELIDAVVHGLGVPFRPKAVAFVPELPKTRNLKIMRRVIRAAWLGESLGDVSSLVNPESIEPIRRAAPGG